MMIYLNSNSEFTGGATNFLSSRYGPQCKTLCSVKPETGMIIVFEHDLWHEGEAVYNVHTRLIAFFSISDFFESFSVSLMSFRLLILLGYQIHYENRHSL